MAETPERDAICAAFVQATASVPDIIGDLHALHYYGCDLHPDRRQRIIADAVTAAQTLLVAVVTAERAMKPPALIVVEKQEGRRGA